MQINYKHHLNDIYDQIPETGIDKKQKIEEVKEIVSTRMDLDSPVWVSPILLNISEKVIKDLDPSNQQDGKIFFKSLSIQLKQRFANKSDDIQTKTNLNAIKPSFKNRKLILHLPSHLLPYENKVLNYIFKTYLFIGINNNLNQNYLIDYFQRYRIKLIVPILNKKLNQDLVSKFEQKAQFSSIKAQPFVDQRRIRKVAPLIAQEQFSCNFNQQTSQIRVGNQSPLAVCLFVSIMNGEGIIKYKKIFNLLPSTKTCIFNFSQDQFTRLDAKRIHVIVTTCSSITTVHKQISRQHLERRSALPRSIDNVLHFWFKR